MSEKPWDGRFSEPTDRAVEAFTSSVEVDRRLYQYDIDGSIAHCKTLARAGILTEDECGELIGGLEKVREEIADGRMEFSDRLEDIHMHVEDRLAAHVGALCRKLHTARSRNDQIALDERLYLKAETQEIITMLSGFRRALVEFAEVNINVVMPGYTHLQRAQPVLFSHHVMAYYEMFSRDTWRFADALERMDVMPLGSAALAGTTYQLDRQYTAQLLGFSKVSENSMDAVSDRDFMIEFMSACSICMMHLSRLSEELVIWSSAEFDFVELPDAFCTGSSIMPQKKNPDIPELVRGKSGRVFGGLMQLLTLMKSLPLAYNRDMQEDKIPVMDAADTLKACLDVYTRMIPRIRINPDTTGKAAAQGFQNATDMADYLVSRGMSFREAHACVGKAVAYALDCGKELHELDLEELRGFSQTIDEDIYRALSVSEMIERRRVYGGTAGSNVAAAVARAKKRLDGEKKQ
ncbi:MAG: argininosuccinate lyase [Desulfobacteraceae bacterium]|nr:argininosuccinate lyase [Desulfobacteraceae bacterium]